MFEYLKKITKGFLKKTEGKIYQINQLYSKELSGSEGESNTLQEILRCDENNTHVCF